MSRKKALILALAALLLLTVTLVPWLLHKSRGQVYSTQLFAMDTVMSLTAYGPHARAAVDEAAGELRRLDELWSVGSIESEISRLNAQGGGEVSEDTKVLLSRALELSRGTGGLFDATIYPLVELWGFPTDDPHVPEASAIAETLPLVDSGRVTLAGETVTLGPGQKLDLGGIAKGYAADEMKKYLNAHGAHEGFINLGGNVLTLGEKADGNAYCIGIRRPFSEAGDVITALDITDQSVVTSGRYERYFEKNDRIYHHILDPDTGYPYDNDLNAVTILSGSSMDGDALSTICFALGMEKGMEFIESMPDVDAIFIDTDNCLHDTRR